MSLATEKATVISTEVNAALGSNTISITTIQQILTALMNILTSCVPATGASARLAKPRILDRLIVRRKCVEYAPGVDEEILVSSILDEAQSLTTSSWIQAYAEHSSNTESVSNRSSSRSR